MSATVKRSLRFLPSPSTGTARRRIAPLAVASMLAGMLAVVAPNVSNAQTDDVLPMISDVELARAEVGPGDEVAAVINGRFMVEQVSEEPTVTVDADPATFDVLAWDDNQIFGTLVLDPTTAPGQHTLIVEQPLPDGTISTATATNAFRVGFTPSIDAPTPDLTWNIDTTQTLSITGSLFDPSATVELVKGSAQVTPSSVTIGTTAIDATFAADPALELATWQLKVTNPGGLNDSVNVDLVATNAPSITSPSPWSTVLVGPGASEAVTVVGDNFYDGITASYTGGGVSISVARTDHQNLGLTISAGGSSNPSTGNLVLTNGDGQSYTVASAIEVVAKPVVPPSQDLTLMPSGVYRKRVLIEGSGFLNDPDVKTDVSFFDESGATTTDFTISDFDIVTDGVELVITVAQEVEHGLRYGVTFDNYGASASCSIGVDATTAADGCFETTPGPKVTDVTPSPLEQGEARTLTITGEGFSVVGTPPNFPFVTFSTPDIQPIGPESYLGPNEISVPVEVASSAAIDNVDVTVVNPDGGRDTCFGCIDIIAAS